MPRKAFIADRQDAIDTFQRPNVSGLKSGEEDGMISLEYHLPDGDSTLITILVPELGDYPGSHAYMIYTNVQHVPKAINNALADVDSFHGVNIKSMLSRLTKYLDKAASDSGDTNAEIDDDPMEVDSDQDSIETEMPYDSDGDDDDFRDNKGRAPVPSMRLIASARTDIVASNERIRHDLRLAKEAGFRVACLGSLFDGNVDGIISLSIRVSKLGVSAEALQMWHVDPHLYFCVLIRYTERYMSFEQIADFDKVVLPRLVQFRVGLQKGYKISEEQARRSFQGSTIAGKVDKQQGDPADGLNGMFISRQLEELLNDRLARLLQYRKNKGFSWQGAEKYYNDHQGASFNASIAEASYESRDKADRPSTLPHLVTADHLATEPTKKSFPLLAMQFALRHLVRCTEFCMVCHSKIAANFEALKPYVCSKPLCLYQYMSLGFGPSIEHEIITQPHVVDLLISFCFTSAFSRGLRQLPVGLALTVPFLDHLMSMPPAAYNQAVPSLPSTQPPPPTPAVTPTPAVRRDQIIKAKFDPVSQDLIFPINERPPLKVGSWIVYGPAGSLSTENYHARVVEVLLPTVKLGPPIKHPRNTSDNLFTTTVTVQSSRIRRGRPLTPTAEVPERSEPVAAASRTLDVHLRLYDQNFDEVDDCAKVSTICALLDTLPTVKEMKRYLLEHGGKDTPLGNWKNRISPAALGILRWIIASNRSCIVQVDPLDGSAQRPEDRVSGMGAWMQFRFAQGAPDKEQRFLSSVRAVKSGAQYPTLFAWHGSPLRNWHSIVREGLNFNQTLHGRAFGDGVYHSLNIQTSLNYSNMSSWPAFRGVSSVGGEKLVESEWARSQLRILSAVALNEVVNAPDQFRSKTPHLVVQQVDWIQSRYLFVMCKNYAPTFDMDGKAKAAYPQDPKYTPTGDMGQSITIPMNAVSRARRELSSHPSMGDSVDSNKRQKIGNVSTPPDDAIFSDETDGEDNMIFFPTKMEEEQDESKEEVASLEKGKAKEASDNAWKADPKTDFVPGTHGPKTLPLTHPPTYATSAATRSLQRELTETLKTQCRIPASELGWYMDRDLIENVYQWIIELHSFDSQLPLTKDLESKGLKSIVLEIRFGKDYPMSPPFVRVIRPRFLPFASGGGGHVTAGGALCMELLTNSGWMAGNNVESVLLQVRMALSSTDPRPARLMKGPVSDYGTGEAVEAFVRACQLHGWQVPPDFRTNFGQPAALVNSR